MPDKENARAGEQRATLKNSQSNHNKSSHKLQSNLDKSGLMSPPVVLDALGIRYQRAGARLAVYCPFHKGGKERNPSLMMHPKDGYYKCFTCGEKGGDVIAFYRAVTDAGFSEAARILSAWRAGV